MHQRRGICIAWSLALAAAGLTGALAPVPAMAQSLIPLDYFTAPVTPGGEARLEAQTLVIDTPSGTVTATGDVVFHYQGYRVSGEHLIYNRRTGATRFRGPVAIRDPSGNVLEGVDLDVTGGMRSAVIAALAIRGYDGTLVTADSAEYDAAARNLLHNMTYAPCGECIDAEGRRIGWSVRASRVVQNNADNSVEIENAVLEILGLPIAWLPYLWLPDTRGTILDDIETPTIGYSEPLGLSIEAGYRAYSSPLTDIILSPRLMSRQGLLLGAEWVQRFEGGSFRVRGSGVYQLDPDAFGFAEARRPWRGAIQSSGSFRPVPQWVVGWSHTAFTDAAFLPDYRLDTAEAARNEVYATHVSADTYFDLRLQQFNRLGNVTAAQQAQQGAAIPNARLEHILELGEGLGRLELRGRLLGVRREADQVSNVGGVTHVHGFAGESVHAMVEAGWQNQWIAPGGVALTPYLGLRADAAGYDGGSAHPLAPGAASLLTATPIAALDIRWPWAGRSQGSVHLVEPIAQLVYRGGSESRPGITNDDAQSFVFDETNLFSFNRFSGADRQETGLRANLGGRYMAAFADGSHLEIVMGQSFHLAGPNAFSVPDPAQPGATAALAGTASHLVLGAQARLTPEIGGRASEVRLAARLQADPSAQRITRAALGASAALEGHSATLSYFHEAANPAAGVGADRHEIGGEIGVPLMDYWRLTAGGYWDLGANTWLRASGGLRYDDGYLEIGAEASVNGPTHVSPNEGRATLSFRLKAPSGFTTGGTAPIPFRP